MKIILGKKLGMTQVFLPTGEVVPVTKVLANNCLVTQIKDKAIQLGFGDKKEYLLNKPEAGHLNGLSSVRFLKDFPVDTTAEISRGDIVSVETFSAGDLVSVEGTSKGKGFAGVVKRHHFGGGPASHGHKDNLRAPGSIGAGGVQRVFKGMRMAGHMGDAKVTVKNLEIIEVHPDSNELYIKGAVPGGRNGLIAICGQGPLKVIKNKKDTPESQPVVEPVVAEAVPTEENLAASNA